MHAPASEGRIRHPRLHRRSQGVTPLSYLELWLAKQDEIDGRARRAFDGPRPADVDPDYDIVELRGHWADGNCDYFVNAWLRRDGTSQLTAITFDFDPIKIDPEPESADLRPQSCAPTRHRPRHQSSRRRGASVPPRSASPNKSGAMRAIRILTLPTD